MPRIEAKLKLAVLLTTFLIASLSINSVAQDQEVEYLRGRVKFAAGRDIVRFSNGITGIHVNTTLDSNQRSELPRWRLLGAVAVDSLVYWDSTVALDRMGQSDAVSVASTQLLESLVRLEAVRIVKSFPRSIPGDTLYWDSIRMKWHTLPDLSVHYEVFIPGDMDVRVAIRELRTVSGIRMVAGIEEPIQDRPGGPR